MNLWLKRSLARAVFLSLLAVSIIPIAFISLLFTRQSTAALVEQAEANLQSLAQSEAEEINTRLSEVANATKIVARHAVVAMQQDVTTEELSRRLARYKPDERNIVGLDLFYEEQGGEAELGQNLSNIYWDNNTPPTEQVLRQIVQTESLDTTFGSIEAVSPDTRRIYMITGDGLMRLYPWRSNDTYPDRWDPRNFVFYGSAEPNNNPELQTRWTAPYLNDPAIGWEISVSTPMLDDNNQFMGILAHEIAIDPLRYNVLEVNVLDRKGFALLLDQNGNVIAHPGYVGNEERPGPNLLEGGTPGLQDLIKQMTAGESGLGYYTDEQGVVQLMVFAPVPEIGWSLGIVVPQTAVTEPTRAMQLWAVLLTVVLAVTAASIALFLAQRIYNPLLQLVHSVNQLAEDHQADEIPANSFEELNQLAQAFNTMAAKVWQRQERLKATVHELQIEIDTHRQQKQVESITETDYFKNLEVNADRLRDLLKGQEGE